MPADAIEQNYTNPINKIHGANMGPIWVLSAPDGSHVGPMNLAIREAISRHSTDFKARQVVS